MATTEDCIWRNQLELKYSWKYDLSKCITTAVTLFLWLVTCSAIMLCQLRETPSIRYIINYMFAIGLRRSMPVMLDLVTQLMYFKFPCEAEAFLETVLGCLEVETLVSLCIERYCAAKYKRSDYPTHGWMYILASGLKPLLIVSYAIFTYFGIGKFDKDFNCVDCTYDMVLPEGWKKIPVILVFFMTTVKSGLVMIYMLTRARLMENKSPTYRNQRRLTNSVICMVLGYLVFSAPLCYIRAKVIYTQMMHGELEVPFSIRTIQLAKIVITLAPCMSLLGLLITQKEVRAMVKAIFGRIDDPANSVIPAAPTKPTDPAVPDVPTDPAKPANVTRATPLVVDTDKMD